MKTKLYLLLLFVLITFKGFPQDKKETRIPLIGELAPEFTAESTMGKITFPTDYYMKWKILFSHPADFTSVCSTELIELAALQSQFASLDAKIVVLSTDGLNSHMEWVRSMETVRYKGRNPVKITFPLVSDQNLEISRKYGMLHSYASITRDVRGVFIIDPSDKIRAIFFYPMEVGRNLDEIVRTLIALQTNESNKVLLPANWVPGQDVMVPAPKTVDEAEKLAKNKDADLYSVIWYMWFKKLKVEAPMKK
ncbi:MAG: peroxiredoxin [Bacteroidetes bacterium]|nr:peroxiredoxin [Bacteroidota bacterium]